MQGVFNHCSTKPEAETILVSFFALVRFVPQVLSLLDKLNQPAPVMEPEKSEHPHPHDYFILANHPILGTWNTVAALKDHLARTKPP